MPWIDACATTDIDAEDLIRFDHAGATYAIYHSPDGQFDYRTGEAKRAPVCINLKTYKTKVEGARVYIEVS